MATHSPEWTQGYWQGVFTGSEASYAEASLRFPEWNYDQLERYLNGVTDGVTEIRRADKLCREVHSAA